MANHRLVPDLNLEVREHLVLVGPNESGKTSLLRLLDASLAGSTAALYAVITAEAIRDVAHPLVVEIEFGDFTAADKAALVEQIEVQATGDLRMRLQLRATSNGEGSDLVIERTFIKPGLALAASATALSAIGWTYLPAARSPDRELGAGRTSSIKGLLDSVDLEASASAVNAALDDLHRALHEAPSLAVLRASLAEALSELLPRDVLPTDLALELPKTDAQAPLADIEVKLKEGGSARPLREQSDGVRAMSTVAVQLLAKGSTGIVAVDEPEIHLHPRAQARTATMLRSKAGQAIVATHSQPVLTRFSPMHVVAFVNGACRQLPKAPFDDDPKAADHWWTSPTLEPLTGRSVLLVEGVADRVVVEAVARQRGVDLDRLGVVVASVDGAGGFKMALRLFGTSGFSIPLTGVVDLKEAAAVARYLGIDPSAVPAAGFVICDEDLESECVRGLGPARHATLLVASGIFKEAAICSGNGVASIDLLQAEDYAAWCRGHKTEVATALAAAMTPADAAGLAPLVAAVDAARAKAG